MDTTIFHFKLTPEEADHLEHYKIQTRDESIINNKINIPYLFIPINNIIPKWVVPNMITLSGNVMPILAFTLMTILYPDYSQPLPAWMCIFNSFSILWFWIADSCDGIRARSSGICSPIGDWLDHSLDNVTYFCFVGFLDHMFLCNSVIKDMLIVLFMVYTSYCVQIQAIYTHAINLGIINASCEGIMGFIGLVFLSAFIPFYDFKLFGIPVFQLLLPIIGGLLVIHTLVMIKGIKNDFPDKPEYIKESIEMLINSMVCVFVGILFYYSFCNEFTTTNYIFNNLWIYFCSLIYVNMIIQSRLFGRDIPKLYNMKFLIALLTPIVLICFCSFTTSVIIGAVVGGVVMWTDWIATLLSMLDGLHLKLFQHEPTRFAPKKN
ncbi:aminoalcoholphosphotransferase, putative [Entamoeba histolytica HM-1:IMSS-B]|uniref:Aminoalcoholphosphotransferase, putative n=6 Tax=Entamoeba histolytica TaxID=5759 RepID=C4M9P0_ENTH1|nr:aminoalcoholphosphotransferase, putative [Entamoeba histolytica HM-1:IMSS]EMD42588.1 amino alcoholphosphotransferase, putative [Entamoeba histolytica KU27]EMH77122.1 aminoalcoholphosphotransferase, putative [Entamoeba histolytica HM-1:IMSS-B]EMS11119.1 aminoalcoholphosphotransferase [Entamoeba histolytica HM-3:IMSS]ENY64059.1 aminoalcoholphosphotransferase, putative [Entamoeba histolytica HM-1:IMSS-A]GAT98405.1 aminoalcoholphosphotransferase putative [Entamoeba histolytica]|eukprot:XP_654313.1 aminoalcoholphosphotransferase, putative [Entamoeba histolytica HM-1:IMSS]